MCNHKINGICYDPFTWAPLPGPNGEPNHYWVHARPSTERARIAREKRQADQKRRAAEADRQRQEQAGKPRRRVEKSRPEPVAKPARPEPTSKKPAGKPVSKKPTTARPMSKPEPVAKPVAKPTKVTVPPRVRKPSVRTPKPVSKPISKTSPTRRPPKRVVRTPRPQQVEPCVRFEPECPEPSSVPPRRERRVRTPISFAPLFESAGLLGRLAIAAVVLCFVAGTVTGVLGDLITALVGIVSVLVDVAPWVGAALGASVLGWLGYRGFRLVQEMTPEPRPTAQAPFAFAYAPEPEPVVPVAAIEPVPIKVASERLDDPVAQAAQDHIDAWTKGPARTVRQEVYRR